MSKQQKQALDYFDSHAGEWKQKALGKIGKCNVVKERNDFVLKVLSERKQTCKVLDVGCGTGDLIIQITKKGIEAVGVDFAKEMITTAKKNAPKKARFECCSIFDLKTKPNEFDLVSANGFIEYISYKELDALFEKAFDCLKPNGSFVLGSRNRLFNVFSLNEYTKEEIYTGNIELLLQEVIEIIEYKNVKELLPLVSLQDENKHHVETGIEVSTRYQFTPAQLIHKGKEKGFEAVEIFPIHIHLLKYVEKDKTLIPFSSSFMINFKKVLEGEIQQKGDE